MHRQPSQVDLVKNIISKTNSDLYAVLESLPVAEDLSWHKIDNISIAHKRALLVGQGIEYNREVHLFASLTKRKPGSKSTLRLQYGKCVDEKLSNTLSTWKPQSPSHIFKKPLLAPFRHNANTNEAHKAKWNTVIRWYFMQKGLLPEADQENREKEAKQFAHDLMEALKGIQDGQAAEEVMCDLGDLPLYAKSHHCNPFAPASTDGTILPADPSTQRRSSRHSPAISQLPDPDAHTGNSSFFDVLRYSSQREYRPPNFDDLVCKMGLSSDRELLLHFQFNEADWATKLVDNVPKNTLMIGKVAQTGESIVSYCYRENNQTCIRYATEDPADPERGLTRVRADNINRKGHDIKHPFHLVYDEGRHHMDQLDKRRLAMLLKWYFIAHGDIEYEYVEKTSANFVASFKAFLIKIRARLHGILEADSDEELLDEQRSAQDEYGEAEQSSESVSSNPEGLVSPLEDAESTTSVDIAVSSTRKSRRNRSPDVSKGAQRKDRLDTLTLQQCASSRRSVRLTAQMSNHHPGATSSRVSVLPYEAVQGSQDDQTYAQLLAEGDGRAAHFTPLKDAMLLSLPTSILLDQVRDPTPYDPERAEQEKAREIQQIKSRLNARDKAYQLYMESQAAEDQLKAEQEHAIAEWHKQRQELAKREEEIKEMRKKHGLTKPDLRSWEQAINKATERRKITKRKWRHQEDIITTAAELYSGCRKRRSLSHEDMGDAPLATRRRLVQKDD